MNPQFDPEQRATLALDVFLPEPNALYSLDAAAHLAGVRRRALLLYCRAGLVQPVLREPYGEMAFTEEAIHAVRRMEHLRIEHAMNAAALKAVFDLLTEVEHLRSELRFLRGA